MTINLSVLPYFYLLLSAYLMVWGYQVIQEQPKKYPRYVQAITLCLVGVFAPFIVLYLVTRCLVLFHKQRT